jgi:hypothetical protein
VGHATCGLADFCHCHTSTLVWWFLLAGSYVTDFPESLSHLTDLTAETSAHSPKNETVTMKRKYVGNENLQAESS